MRAPRSTRLLMLAVAGATVALAPQVASAASTEEPIAVELVTLTKPKPNNNCHVSTFAVVEDRPDVAEFRVVYTQSNVPGREFTLVFNRHHRGKIQFADTYKTWSPGPGKVAGFVAWGAGGGPSDGDFCAKLEAVHKERYAVARATVVRYTPTAPGPKAGAIEFASVAVPPANHGTTGKDSCKVGRFATFPAVKGAKRYRITITSMVGTVQTTRTISVDAARVSAKPTDPTLRPLRRAGKLVHFLGSTMVYRWGCTQPEWMAAEAIRKVIVSAETS